MLIRYRVGDRGALAGLARDPQRLLVPFDAEYIDMCRYGTLEEHLPASGTTELDPVGETVIPNHIEPFQ